MKKGLLLFLVVTFLMCSASLLTAQQICSNQTGQNGGYYYEHWTDGGGSACMTLNAGGAFSVTWQNCGNFVSRKGRNYDDTQTYQQLGNININYSATYNPSGNSYLTVYGWTHNPLIEFYIVEAWGSWRPPGSSPSGTATIDGGTYDLYQTTRTNQPSIEGTKTFQQYWSVRQSKKTSGTISVAEHFKAWGAKGWSLGKFHEISMAIEGYQSSGSGSMNSMSFGGATATPTPTLTATRTATPTITITQPPACTLKGDVNGSGTVDVVDALMIAQYSVGLNPSNFKAACADMNCSGVIDIIDALLIAQRVVGLISNFPC